LLYIEEGTCNKLVFFRGNGVIMKEIIEKIFEYDNYRAFLKDYFSLMKKKKAFFTLKYFAKKAGFNSASFCMYVIDGRRNLSYKSIPKMIKGLELRGKRATYFENLVLMNQATSIEERERYYSTIEKLRKSTKYYKINKKHSFGSKIILFLGIMGEESKHLNQTMLWLGIILFTKTYITQE